MCEKCKNTKDWKFCPYCGHELHKEIQDDKTRMTQDKFDKIFLDMLKNANKVVWIKSNGGESDIPTCNFELRNAKNEWMFDIQLDSVNPRFWYSYYRVYKVFNEQYGLEQDEIHRLMQKQLNLLFKMKDVTPLTTCN